VKTFGTVREAKDYLASKIAEESGREGAPLTEVERKMLYFSETDWTLPDMMEVNAEFDRDYNEVEYEEKIGRLVHRIQERQNSGQEEQKEEWSFAIEKLRVEDDYLLILVDAGSSTPDDLGSPWNRLMNWLPDLNKPLPRKCGDRVRLVLLAFAIIFVMILVRIFLDRLFGAH
jgi:hypothetical protein